MKCQILIQHTSTFKWFKPYRSGYYLQLEHITACGESQAMYKSLLSDSISPIFNTSSQIHKGSISWRQQCHKQDAHYRGYQLISPFSSPRNPNRYTTHPPPRYNFISNSFFFSPVPQRLKQSYDYNTGEKRINIFG